MSESFSPDRIEVSKHAETKAIRLTFGNSSDQEAVIQLDQNQVMGLLASLQKQIEATPLTVVLPFSLSSEQVVHFIKGASRPEE